MRNTMACKSRSLLLAAVLCAATTMASVPTEATVSGTVTGMSSESIRIDGVTYALEPGELTRAALADVRVGDSVTIAIRPRRPPAPADNSHPVSAGHEVVHPATAGVETTVRVMQHASARE